MAPRRSKALLDALAIVAPGTQLREGLDRVVKASMGALIVVGDGPEVLNICSGGFLLDAAFSPQRLSELAKTDLWKTVQRAPSRARFPGGESLAEMQTRMVSALEAVVARHPGELVVVVSHADPIKAAIAHYTGVHLDLFQRIVVSPASVTVFELSAHGAAMLKCNDTGTLDELLPPPPADSAQPTAEAAAAGKVDGA